MGLEYKGNRYVPKIHGQWDKEVEYEPLTVVLHEGNSYTSKTIVPQGIEITNALFWACTGDYNAQVAQYKTDLTNKMNDVIQKVNDELATQDETINNKVNTAINKAETNIQSKFDTFTETIEHNNTSFKEDINSNIDTFKQNVGESVTALNEVVDYKTSLAKELNFTFRNFIDFLKNDSNLHLQGMCKISSNIVIIAYGTLDNSEKGKIISYNLDTNTVIKTYENLSIWHANDLSYKADTKELYIASMYEGNGVITVFDYTTMTKKTSITLTDIAPLEDNLICGVHCSDTYYYVATGKTIYKYGYDNVLISKFNYLSPHNIIQSLVEVDGYIYIVELYNIMVYDLKGNLVRNFNTPRGIEMEGMVHINNFQFLISNSNNAKVENNDFFNTVDFSGNDSNYTWLIHHKLTDLGISVGSETMIEIAQAMGSRTKLYWEKTMANESTDYPINSGLLEVTKYDESKVVYQFTQASSLGCNIWVANFNNNLSGKFSGWKKLATSDTVYSFNNYAELGMTVDDFVTDFATNVATIISKVGKNKKVHLYPYSGESNMNLYNSVKAWCGHSSDAYTVMIETSYNGSTNLPNRITVIPNASDGQDVEIVGFYDNVLGTAKIRANISDVNSLIATAKSEIIALCDSKYQSKS